jgi:DNA-binding NarL/FixJ family response regulator
MITKERNDTGVLPDMSSQVSPTGCGGGLQGMNIMIAEDDWLLADTLAVLLEEQGAHIIGPSPESRSATALVESAEIDFALVDMNLRDGFSDNLIEQLRYRQIPFAIVTAYHNLPTNAGEHAVMTLHKPLDHKVLFNLLKKYMRGQSSLSQDR